MSYDVVCRPGSDPTLLWLWCWPAAVTLIGPLAWEPLYMAGVALNSRGKKNQYEFVEYINSLSQASSRVWSHESALQP